MFGLFTTQNFVTILEFFSTKQSLLCGNQSTKWFFLVYNV